MFIAFKGAQGSTGQRGIRGARGPDVNKFFFANL